MNWSLVFILIASGLTVGCGKDTGRDRRAPVSGRVTYAGEPVTEGRIMFYPEDGRRMAMSAIDATGHYALTTFDSKDGAFLGKHKVVIDAVRETTSGPSSPEEELEAADVGVERLVPAIYADRNSSPLEAEVKDEDNTIDFELPR